MYRWRLELKRVALGLAPVDEAGSLAKVLAEREAGLVFNAGFFGLDGEPVGLSAAGGRVWSRHRPGLSGGVLTVRDGRATLHKAETFAHEGSAVDFALQCRPRLVVKGRVNIGHDDGKRADRADLQQPALGLRL